MLSVRFAPEPSAFNGMVPDAPKYTAAGRADHV